MEEEYSHEIRVPKDRLAVLIGKKGRVKRELEDRIGVSLDVDSKEAIVVVRGSQALSVFLSQQVIKAIARGFSPETALRLLQIDMAFELVSIPDFIKHKNHLERVRGRVIGTEGRTRAFIEEITETQISVYGKTVGIIGRAEYVTIARRAVESLLSGSPHSTVYRWLEKQRRILKRKEFEENEADLVKDHVKQDLYEVRSFSSDDKKTKP